jgi:hypothetical protein
LLYLRPGTREHFLASLEKHWPELMPHYAQLYAGRAYLPKEVTGPVVERVGKLSRIHGVGSRPRHFTPPAEPQQLTLLAG